MSPLTLVITTDRKQIDKAEAVRQALTNALARTAADAAVWPEVCDILAQLVDGVGASFHAVSSPLPPAIYPASPSLNAYFKGLVDGGWHKKSPRPRGLPILVAKGSYTEADFITEEEMRSSPYYSEFLPTMGLKWVVGLGFKVNGYDWVVAVQGSDRRGPFTAAEIDRLVDCRAEVEVAAQRSASLGLERVEAQLDWSERTNRGVIGFSSERQVRCISPIAISMLTKDLSVESGKLRAADQAVDEALHQLIDVGIRHALNSAAPEPEPLLVPREGSTPLVVDSSPLPSDAGTVFCDTVLLVTMRPAALPPSLGQTLRDKFGLSPRESELAVKLSDGTSLTEAADELAMKVSTARSHLHTIFLKTETKRQAELVALVNRS